MAQAKCSGCVIAFKWKDNSKKRVSMAFCSLCGTRLQRTSSIKDYELADIPPCFNAREAAVIRGKVNRNG